MNRIVAVLSVGLLLVLSGCTGAILSPTQLAERFGLINRNGGAAATVPVIYPAERGFLSGPGGAADEAAGWEYGVSGILRADNKGGDCTK
ncbi:MAG: hypothetical protein ACOY32_01810 [Thermodesulfobacteriota bacterium]